MPQRQKQNKTKNKLIDKENRLVVARGEMQGVGKMGEGGRFI